MSETDKPVARAADRPAPACTLVIFGAHGDLTKRLLMPTLYDLKRQRLLADGFAVIGVDHVDSTDDAWRDELSQTVQEFTKDPDAEFYTPHIDQADWGWLMQRVSYLRADFTKPDDFKPLTTKVTGSAIFYLAIAGRFFATVVDNLGGVGLLKQPEGAFRRLVVEKPFGSDLKSAQALNARILKQAAEEQVYRIDHFVGKETIQNILAFRFGNGIFEPIWRREYIDHVQITASETVGVEERGSFYDPTGALRDMVPNHLFQIMGMIGTEPPTSFEANAVRSAKQELLNAIRPMALGDAALGQYTAGRVQGRDVPAYRDSHGVPHDSHTETYVALKLTIDNWRWAGVPFYLRTGKCMSARRTEAVVHFKQAPYALFRDSPVASLAPNNLTLNIQPKQGITLGLNAKKPGARMELAGVDMAFRYDESFKVEPNVGYESLLYDCMNGDQTLFQRADNIESSWAAVDPVLQGLASGAIKPEDYAAGSDGPANAEALLTRDGREWYGIK